MSFRWLSERNNGIILIILWFMTIIIPISAFVVYLVRWQNVTDIITIMIVGTPFVVFLFGMLAPVFDIANSLLRGDIDE